VLEGWGKIAWMYENKIAQEAGIYQSRGKKEERLRSRE